MIYIILVCLYGYLIIKVLFSIAPKARQLAKKVGPRISILEFFIIALVLSYLFNYYYLQSGEFKSFIVPVEVIWLSFSSSILLFGIAVGSRFILNLSENFVPIGHESSFENNKKVYDVFTLIWLNLSTLMIFFSYSMMEISRPIERIDSLQNIFIILGLSAFLGILFYFMHKEINSFVKKITVIGMALISICLVLFIYESQTDFLISMPFTTSFIVFNITFFLSLIINLTFSWIKNRKSLNINVKTKNSEKSLEVNEQNPSFQVQNQIFNSYQVPDNTQTQSAFSNNSNLLYSKNEIQINHYSQSNNFIPETNILEKEKTQTFEESFLGNEIQPKENKFSLGAMK